MAILQSNLVKKQHRHRGIYSGKPYEVAGVIVLPSGTVLATGDDLLAVPVGENQRINKITVTTIGASGALAGSLGYFQITDPDGEPTEVQRIGPRGDADTIFVSPASDPDAYRAAGSLANRAVVEVTSQQPKLPGPVYIGARVTTGATLAEDVEIHIGVEFDGETNPRETAGDTYYANQSYLLNRQ